ncbi:MAG: ATP-binding protein [Bacteriovoracaceae bacterium]|nr:ATP-binding protein [Bacteriovoracaceae bacterium]
MIKRCLQLPEFTKKKSAFLFGPRSTGKSYLINYQLSEYPYIDLLKASERRKYINNPSILMDYVKAHPDTLIIIDEVQLIPELLDEVHHIIEHTNSRFLLTGSSARKLKREGANMLGGRAKKLLFHPLTWRELKDNDTFNLNRYLLYGGIPRIYLSDEPEEELSDYVDTYLDQEIKAEAVSRNILGFERFLARAALLNGEVINFSKIASDTQLSPPTVRQYFEILEDTLLGFYLTPWQGPKRKAIQTAKFYYFDIGVCRFLAQIPSLPEQSNLYGKAFESFIIQEIFALCSYKRLRKKLFFWRTTHQDEVDLLIGDDFAIEIKSGSKMSPKSCKGLQKIKDEGFKGRLILLSKDSIRRDKDNIEYWPWEDFLSYIWNNL